jgi:hypothetical protein
MNGHENSGYVLVTLQEKEGIGSEPEKSIAGEGGAGSKDQDCYVFRTIIA